MKKILSMIMVIGIFLSAFIVPVNAEPTNTPPETGSITITNATKGKDYTIYKVFEAKVLFDSNNNVTGVTYHLERTTENAKLFDALFKEDENGNLVNDYFDYNPSTHQVTQKQTVLDSEAVKHLTEVINNLVDKENYPNDGIVENAQDARIEFKNLEFGYYLITSTLGSFVTIDSTAPDAVVIDKNQTPGENFGKYVQTGEQQKVDENGPVLDENGNPVMEPKWGKLNSANIGDKVSYKVEFDATNYDGTNKIKYYQVHDDKGSALWVEFDSIKVFVNGVELKRGYYLCAGDIDDLDPNREWLALGDWEGDTTPTTEEAQWFLIHQGFDQFRISIPWLEGHKITTVPQTDSNGNTVNSYSLTYPDGLENADFLYTSPARVEVYYDAGIEHNASIGDVTNGNLFNKSWATWVYEGDSDNTPPSIVETEVFGAGLTKKDGNNHSINLAGAVFEVYRDKDCREPVYVIPTDVDGVYIVDSLNTYVHTMSGVNRQPTRVLYQAYLEDYLGPNWETTQKNVVTTQVNGKLIVLGLEKGTYYFKEITPPLGYNSLKDPYQIEITDTSSRSFNIFVDDQGNVANITEPTTDFKETSYMLTPGLVENFKGQTLPTTGAKGTIALITAGSIISILFAILLITHKKMSIYKD